MSTLKERFAEKFKTNNKAEIVCKHNAIATSAEVFSFMRVELLLLAEEVKKETLPHQSTNGTSHTKDKKYIRGLTDAAALIRSKAAELN